jgi:PadR family transcriptional regulator PadR
MTTAPAPKNDLLAGTREMMVLRTLSLGSLHGYAIAQHITRTSNGLLRVEQGSLYLCLERLLNKGWVTSHWAETPTKRQARYTRSRARDESASPRSHSTTSGWRRRLRA